MSEEEKEEVFKIGVEIGEIIGRYGTDKQIELFKKMLEDYKIKSSGYFKLQKENKELKELVGVTTIRIKPEDITMVADNFISKDKIRTKIKELEETTAEELRYDFLMNRDEVKSSIIKILEELLN